jgi:hypothetical protein
MTMKNTPPPPSAANAIARTVRFVAAAAASLLIVGPVDVLAWGLAGCRNSYCGASYSGAQLIVAWASLVLALLLTPAALVWVTRLFIRAVRSSMPPPTLAERPVARTTPSVGAAAERLLVVVGLLLVMGLLYSSYGGAALIVPWALGILAALLTLAAPVWVTMDCTPFTGPVLTHTVAWKEALRTPPAADSRARSAAASCYTHPR